MSIDKLTQAGGISVTHITKLLSEHNTPIDIRETAAWALGILGDHSATPALLGVLSRENDAVWWTALRAMTQLVESGAHATLLRLLRQLNDTDKRNRIIHVLGHSSGTRGAIQALINVLNSNRESPLIRGSAAESLGWIGKGKRRVLKVLLASLSDASPEVRYWSAFALGTLGDPRVLPELERVAPADIALAPNRGTVADECRDAIAHIVKAVENP